MKLKFKKFLKLFMAVALFLSILTPTFNMLSGNSTNVAYAQVEGDDEEDSQLTGKTNTIKLHKVIIPKDDSHFPSKQGRNNVEYKGQNIADIANYFGATSKEIAGAFFALKTADGQQYIGTDGRPKEASFKLTETNKNEILGGVTQRQGIVLNVSNLTQAPTEYTIVEVPELSTYVGTNGETLTGSKAVPVKITLPFVNDEGIVTEPHVYPKNTEDKPQIDKNFKQNNGLNNLVDDSLANVGAMYENFDRPKATASVSLGTEVPYQVKTKIPKDAHYKTLRWEDTMTKGLTYSKDLEIKANVIKPAEEITLTENEDYEKVENASGFVLKFKDAGLEKIAEKAKVGEVEFELNYKAVVNGSAVVEVTDENKVKFDYSNKPKTFVDPRTTSVTGKTEISVTKTWAEGNAQTGVTATYFLYEKGADAEQDKVVASHEADGTVEKPFDHTFTGLDNTKTYYVKEVVSGYTPTYTAGDGLAIRNTPDTENPKPLIPTSPKVVTYGKKFVKTDNSANPTRLQGAEFVVKNLQGQYLALKDADTTALKAAKTELDTKVEEYNNLSAEEQKTQGAAKKAAIATAQDAYNKAFIAAKNAYEWVSSKDGDNVVKLVSDANGKFEITGLEAKDYKLVETKAPKDFAGEGNEFDFTVTKGSYMSSANTAGHIEYTVGNQVDGYGLKIINKKITIPFTGGIGTIIFIISGLALMGGSVFAMRKRRIEE